MGTQTRNIVDRFWDKVDRKGDDECWEWKACKSEGYGRLGLKYRSGMVFAHRLAYMLFKGDIPEGMQIDHLCRNRACCNPNHLEIVTSKENTLRGIGITATNARKIHCPNGHEYDITSQHGYRRCSICKKEYDYKRHQLLLKEKEMENGKTE
jgi:hypothetical protein